MTVAGDAASSSGAFNSNGLHANSDELLLVKRMKFPPPYLLSAWARTLLQALKQRISVRDPLLVKSQAFVYRVFFPTKRWAKGYRWCGNVTA